MTSTPAEFEDRPAASGYDVVEMRVHGVGGATPEELLGVPSPLDSIRVAGDEEAGFYARREDRHVEGYVWGGLSSRPATQPAWVLLLPFTLVNVAGWLSPEDSRVSWRPLEAFTDFLQYIFALSLTATYALWIAFIATDQIAIRWGYARIRGVELIPCPPAGKPAAPACDHIPIGFAHDRLGHTVAIAAGFVLALAAGLLLRRVTKRSQARFEGQPSAGIATPTSWSGSAIAERHPTLRDQAFWARAGDSKRLLMVHSVVWVGVLATVLGLCLARANKTDTETLGVPHLFRLLLLGQIGLLILMFVLRQAAWPFFRGGLRYSAGNAIVCTIALAFAESIFYGLADVLYRTIHAGRAPGPLGVPAGAFGLAVGATLLVIAVWYIWPVNLPGELGQVGEPPLGEEVKTLSPAVARRRSKQISIANVLPHIGVALLPGAVAYLAAALWIVLQPHESAGHVLGPAELFLRQFGDWLLFLSATALIAYLVRGSRKASGRRVWAIAWDVLSFWPRRYHPLAVRPYAERAVPELQARLQHHLRSRRRVVLSAHSQGSVLAYAALLQLQEHQGKDAARGIALVTYGCPLRNLQARFFPRYFAPDDFESLSQGLVELSESLTPWRNFYRSTDYVGRWIFSKEPTDVRDRPLDDPPTTPLVDDRPLNERVPATFDPQPAPWTKLSIHSHYTSEPELRLWIDQGLVPALRAGGLIGG